MESGTTVGSTTEGTYFYNTFHSNGTFITRVEAWEAYSCIRAIRVHPGLGLAPRLYGDPSASSFWGTRYRAHSFASGERITRLTLWPTRSGNRVGRIQFVTSRNVTFNACMFNNNSQPNAPTVVTGIGSGVWVGVQGRAGTDMHRLGFLFLRTFSTSCILRSPWYTLLSVSAQPMSGDQNLSGQQPLEGVDDEMDITSSALEEVEEVGGDGEEDEEEEGLEVAGRVKTSHVEYYTEALADDTKDHGHQSAAASIPITGSEPADLQGEELGAGAEAMQNGMSARNLATITRVTVMSTTVSFPSESHVVHWIYHGNLNLGSSSVWSLPTNTTGLVPAYGQVTQVVGSVPRVGARNGDTFFWQLSPANTTTSLPAPTNEQLWWHAAGTLAPGSTNLQIRVIAGLGRITSTPYRATISLPDSFSYATTGTYSGVTYGGFTIETS